MGSFFSLSDYYASSEGGAAPVPFPDGISGLWGRWKYDEADSLYEERSSPSTASSDEGVVGTWRSIEGNDRDLVAESDAKRCIYHAGSGVHTRWRVDGGVQQAVLNLGSVSGLNRNDFGGMIRVDVPKVHWHGTIAFGSGNHFCISHGDISGQRRNVMPFAGSNSPAFWDSGLVPSARRCSIVWRSNGSNLKIWVNGEAFTTPGAIASQALDQIRLGAFASAAGNPMVFREVVVYDEAPSDEECEDLVAYARSAEGALGDGDLLSILGDSLSTGVGSDLGLPWQHRLTNMTGREIRSYSADGANINQPIISAVNMDADATGFTNRTCVLMIGTNDINLGVRTGAQAWASYDAYRASLQGNGWEVVGCTLQAMPSNDSEAQAFNTLLLASSDYDAIADLRANAALDDETDTTYYTSDQVHLKDAGYAAVASEIDAALASL